MTELTALGVFEVLTELLEQHRVERLVACEPATRDVALWIERIGARTLEPHVEDGAGAFGDHDEHALMPAPMSRQFFSEPLQSAFDSQVVVDGHDAAHDAPPVPAPLMQQTWPDPQLLFEVHE
jgi:hypothetical protein